MTCTFFGHRDTPKEKEPILESTLINLIENKNVNRFYIGNNGNFDKMAFSVLLKLSGRYPIKFYIVLSYLPKKEYEYSEYTIFPDIVETVPPRFAISYRNKWMIEQSDYVVTCVSCSWGGAAKFKELAEKRGKIIVEL